MEVSGDDVVRDEGADVNDVTRDVNASDVECDGASVDDTVGDVDVMVATSIKLPGRHMSGSVMWC